MNMFFIQLIGAMAFLLLSISYFKMEKRQILFIQIGAYMLFTIHYFLLSGVAGCVCNVIGLLALVTIYFFDKYKLKNRIVVSLFFIVALIVVNIITFQNIYSIFPMIASTIVILSFMRDNENAIRIIGVVSAMCWLIYAIVYNSYISIVFEAITFLNVCIALTKSMLQKKNK